MAVDTISKNFHKTIIVCSALGILLSSTIVAIVSIVPLYNRLKQDEQKNLLFALKNRTLVVEEYLSRAKDIALQIAGRTKAREKLEAYNQGKATLSELVSFSKGILTEALNQSPELAGISRLDRSGNLAVQLGLSIPSNFWQLSVPSSKKALVSSPISLEGQSYLIVVAPIINPQSQRVGTDILLFKVVRLQQIVEDYTGLRETGEIVLGMVKNDGVQLFFPLRQKQGEETDKVVVNSAIKSALEKAARQEAGMLVGDNSSLRPAVIAYGPIQNTEWGMVVKIDKDELYEPLNRQIGIIGGVIVILIMLTTSGLVLLLRPIAGKVILHTDELERQTQEKTDLLVEKTAALLLEIEQRKQIEEVLLQMEELRFSSTATAQQAMDAAVGASQALRLAQRGNQAVEETLDAQATLKQTVGAIADGMQLLSEKTHQIANISAIVSDLANQTNMLALNAAVEAVRAGDYGKGFAVIATEIRKLADQSNSSAAKIYTLVAQIQAAINATATVTDTGQKTVDAGVKIAEGTASAFTGVTQAVNNIVANNEEISLNAKQQAIAIQQVVDAIAALNTSGK